MSIDKMTPHEAKSVIKYLIEEKKERREYFKKNGTLMGFKDTEITRKDLEKIERHEVESHAGYNVHRDVMYYLADKADIVMNKYESEINILKASEQNLSLDKTNLIAENERLKSRVNELQDKVDSQRDAQRDEKERYEKEISRLNVAYENRRDECKRMQSIVDDKWKEEDLQSLFVSSIGSVWRISDALKVLNGYKERIKELEKEVDSCKLHSGYVAWYEISTENDKLKERIKELESKQE